MTIDQQAEALHPYFDEDEIRRLPHLATTRVLARLEDCRARIGKEDDKEQGTLQEAERLVRLFATIGEFTSNFRERSQLLSHIVFWEDWIRNNGRLAEVGGLDPFGSIQTGHSRIRHRRGYRHVDDKSVERELKDLEGGNNLRAIVFDGIDFQSIDAEKLAAGFKGGLIVDCEFHECNFSTVELPNAHLVRVVFNRCHLGRTDMRGLRAHDIRIRNPQDMSGAKFEDAFFSRLMFDKADRTVSANQGNERDPMKAKGIDFSRAVFADCLFQEVTFEQASFPSAAFDHCSVEGTTFQASDFQAAVFNDTQFSWCLFKGGTLARSIFNECDMAGISLEKGPVSGGARGLALTILEGFDCKTSFDLPNAIWERLSEQDKAFMTGRDDAAPQIPLPTEFSRNDPLSVSRILN